MFKLVVLSVVFAMAVAAPKPGFLHSAPIAIAAPLAIPAAVSHQSRIDIHSKPFITTYAAPAVVAAPIIAHHAVVAAPIVKSYGLIGGYGHGYGFHGGFHGW